MCRGPSLFSEADDPNQQGNDVEFLGHTVNNVFHPAAPAAPPAPPAPAAPQVMAPAAEPISEEDELAEYLSLHDEEDHENVPQQMTVAVQNSLREARAARRN